MPYRKLCKLQYRIPPIGVATIQAFMMQIIALNHTVPIKVVQHRQSPFIMLYSGDKTQEMQLQQDFDQHVHHFIVYFLKTAYLDYLQQNGLLIDDKSHLTIG